MIPFASNIRIPMAPNLGGVAAGLKEKRLLAASSLALVHTVSQTGNRNAAAENTLLLDHAAVWHNNHAEDPGSSTLNFAQGATFNIERPRSCESTLSFSQYVHVILEGYHAPSTTLALVAGETVNVGAPAYITSNNTANLASASDAVKSRAIGLITQAASANSATIVQTDGSVEVADWTSIIGAAALTPGTVYFLHTTDGQMRATPPTGDGEVVVTMGVAVTTTKFDIEVNEVAVL